MLVSIATLLVFQLAPTTAHKKHGHGGAHGTTPASDPCINVQHVNGYEVQAGDQLPDKYCVNAFPVSNGVIEWGAFFTLDGDSTTPKANPCVRKHFKTKDAKSAVDLTNIAARFEYSYDGKLSAEGGFQMQFQEENSKLVDLKIIVEHVGQRQEHGREILIQEAEIGGLFWQLEKGSKTEFDELHFVHIRANSGTGTIDLNLTLFVQHLYSNAYLNKNHKLLSGGGLITVYSGEDANLFFNTFSLEVGELTADVTHSH